LNPRAYGSMEHRGNSGNLHRDAFMRKREEDVSTCGHCRTRKKGEGHVQGGGSIPPREHLGLLLHTSFPGASLMLFLLLSLSTLTESSSRAAGEGRRSLEEKKEEIKSSRVG